VSLGASFDVKEQVRQAVDIVDLVGSYVQLRRQGRNFVALCPWHEDRRPSLNVNPQRQSWKCWVCGDGGDIFSFVMKAEGLEFREALEMLAERAGISLRPAQRQFGQEIAANLSASAGTDPSGEKRALYRLMAWAEEQFHRCLVAGPEGEPGRKYLTDRGISAESVNSFHLGFAPQRWDWLLERARGTEWTPALLERVGLVRRKELDGGHYDWFRGRLMFSIRDARSRPIAFGGRVLPQLAGDRDAKYINSPETPLFSKSRELYGLDLAREYFQAAGGAIVMEGYTDCLMAHQFGITNAVAVLGTALGDRHLQLLRRYTDSITLVLDGDEAGRRRTNEIIDALLALFEKNEVDLRILTLPEGVDPCDFIRMQGSNAFRQLLSQAADALDHKFQAVTQGLDMLTDTHRAAQAAEQMLAALAQVRAAAGPASSRTVLREQQMLGRLARKFHLPEEQLRSRLANLRREARKKSGRGVEDRGRRTEVQDGSLPAAPNSSGTAATSQACAFPGWDREILELMLAAPTFTSRVAVELELSDFTSDVARRIFAACRRQADRGGSFDFGGHLAELDDLATKNLLVSLDEAGAAKSGTDHERWWQDIRAAAIRRREERERRMALDAAHRSPDEAEVKLAQFCEQSRPRHVSEYERRKK
jgi:DNA primase